MCGGLSSQEVGQSISDDLILVVLASIPFLRCRNAHIKCVRYAYQQGVGVC